MVSRLNNSEVSKRLIELGKINIATDTVANQIAEKIVPVLDVKPRYDIKGVSGVRSTTGATTMLTVPTTNRTFLHGAMMSYTANATCDNISVFLTITNVLGNSQVILIALKQTTTAESKTLMRDFTVPIELKKGSSVTIETAFTAGACNIRADLLYHTEDN